MQSVRQGIQAFSGLNVGADPGYYATALGNTTSAWYGGLDLSYGAQLPHSTFMLLSASATGRRENVEIRNLLANVLFTFYSQSFPRRTLVGHASLAERLRPLKLSLSRQPGGLRGYPNFFLIGGSALDGDRRGPYNHTVADRRHFPTRFHRLLRGGPNSSTRIFRLKPRLHRRGDGPEHRQPRGRLWPGHPYRDR
ncbi:MAG: hypothetical protein ACRESR_04015 [Gammaproteobacteria bacterium]